MSRMRRLLSWALLLAAVWVALSFATYDPSADASGATNLGGTVGRFLASTLVEAFGIGAFVLAFYLAFLGYLVQAHRIPKEPILRILGIAVCMVTFGTFWQVLLPDRSFPGGTVPLGGILGDEIAVRLGAALGTVITVLTMGVGGLAGLLLATDDLLPNLIRGGRPALEGEKATLRQILARRLEEAIGRGEPEAAVEDEEEEEEEEYEEDEEEEYEEDDPDLEDDEEWEDEEEEEDDEEWEEEEEEEYEDEDEEVEEPEPVPARKRPAAKKAKPEPKKPAPKKKAAPAKAAAKTEPEPEPEPDPEPEPVPVPARTSAPKITQAVAPVSADGIEVIKLQRDPKVKDAAEKYSPPPLTLLAEPTYVRERESDAVLQKKAAQLEEALQDFNVKATVDEIERGPVITRFDLLLERGTKISKVTGLADDLALALGVGRVRIAAVKGKSVLGVEIPNKRRETVFLRELTVSEELTKRKIAIPLFLGKDASGHPIIEDLATTPHLLIAGRTGAGKSVFVNDLILSILLTRYPEEVRLIMIDPKKVELEVYQDIPHLLTKVESSPKKATKILEWCVNHMEERYELLAATGVRHLTSYNKMSRKLKREKLLAMYSEEEVEKLPEYMPYIVIIVDELADLMMVAGKEVEQSIARLAQKARAVGLHVVLATQRPSTDVITGLIKSNLPARIAFQTRTGIDSRTILDRYGAEKLLDKGDMLYLSSTSDEPRRVQGPFVSDGEVEAVVDYLKENAAHLYTQQLEQVSSSSNDAQSVMDQDELFEEAVDVMFASGMASASGLQRRMKVGYARASRLIDLMSDAGIVSEHRGSKAREILMSPEQWEEMRASAKAGAAR